MRLALPTPTDARRSPGVGCGQIDSELVLPAEKALVRSFSATGAELTVAASAPWTLTVALVSAGVGAQYDGSPNQTARPAESPDPGGPSPMDHSLFSIFNSGNGTAAVTLEGTLARQGVVVWRGTVSGYAGSVQCTRVKDKTREALADAVAALRARVVGAIATAPKP